MKGAAHFETLAGSSSSFSSVALQNSDNEEKDKDQDKDKDKEDLMSPAAVYEVSESVQHLQSNSGQRLQLLFLFDFINQSKSITHSIT